MKTNKGIYMMTSSVYWVVASKALSVHISVVAVLYFKLEHLTVEAERLHSVNVVGLYLALGTQR